MAEYIEREAFKAEIRRLSTHYLNEWDTLGVLAAADRIPAADVRPVVRGKWEDVNVRDYSTNINGGLPLNVASMCCSVCKRWHNEVYHYGNPTEMAHFCPNCGADMRAEEGET